MLLLMLLTALRSREKVVHISAGEREQRALCPDIDNAMAQALGKPGQ